jgi:prepilin-type N-terminal cleavage/methylation domain-containing protein
MRTTGKRDGFTLVEIVIVVAIIGILAAMAIAAMAIARQRSQETACVVNQCRIDDAKEMLALDQKKKVGDVVSWDDVTPYLKGATIPACPAGGVYVLNPIGVDCYCTSAVVAVAAPVDVGGSTPAGAGGTPAAGAGKSSGKSSASHGRGRGLAK